MIKKIIALAILSSAVIQLLAQGVSFTSGLNWEQVKAKAKSSNKYIFIDFYATWCQPCKVMDAEVYPMKSVGDFLNEKFISIKIQTDATKNDNAEIKAWYDIASKLQRQFSINELPSFVFLTPAGELVYKSTGFRSATELVADARNAMDPAKQYESLLQQYEQRTNDGPFVRALARHARTLGQENKAKEIADKYINSLTDRELDRDDDAIFAAEFTATSKDRGFGLMMKDPARFDNYFKQPGIIKGRLETILYVENVKPYQSSFDSKPDWQAMKAGLSKFGILGDSVLIKYRPGLLYRFEVEPLLLTYPQWSEIESKVIRRYSDYELQVILPSIVSFYLEGIPAVQTGPVLVASATLLDKKMPGAITIPGFNTLAYAVALRCTDRRDIETGLEWSRRVLATDSNAGYIDTYATLLYKAGNKEDAIRMQERAVARGGSDPAIKQRLLGMKAGEVILPVAQFSSVQKQWGNWNLNINQSDFGGLPQERAAPVTVRMTDYSSGIIIGRDFAGGATSADTLSADGKFIHLNLPTTRIDRRLIPSADGKILTVFSVYKESRPGEEPYEYRRTETYFPVDDHTLLLYRFTHVEGNVEKVKAVYNRS